MTAEKRPAPAGNAAARTDGKSSDIDDNLLKTIVFSNDEILTIHQDLPREVRYVADLRRWIMTNGALLLNFSHLMNPTNSPLSAAALYREIAHTGIVSESVVATYLREILALGYTEEMPHLDRRTRAYRMTDFAKRMFGLYLDAHLRGLDRLDGGDRHRTATQRPEVLTRMHPLFARAMLGDQAFFRPPASLSPFLTATAGILILHEVTKDSPTVPAQSTELVPVRFDSADKMSKRYGTSRGHVFRLLSKAKANGDYEIDGRTSCVSARLLRDYRRWQTTKLMHIESAYRGALATCG